MEVGLRGAVVEGIELMGELVEIEKWEEDLAVVGKRLEERGMKSHLGFQNLH
jgi:hypothetical protein